MYSTVVLFTTFFLALLMVYVCWGALLHLGLKWGRVKNYNWRGIAAAALVILPLQLVASVVFEFARPESTTQLVLLSVIELGVGVLIFFVVIGWIFQTNIRTSFKAWLTTLLAVIPGLALAFLVYRPFLFEAFTSPANSMAPTLLGQHWTGQCPVCGEDCFCSTQESRQGGPPVEVPVICGNFHANQIQLQNRHAVDADRFLVAKFFTPRRWDIIVFKSPNAPSNTCVFRLVGLPGETIHIADGAVWADGKRLSVPDELEGIEYKDSFSEIPSRNLSGSRQEPAILGPDEYFVLGDFSARAFDSRAWESGVPGRSVFAVPKSDVIGVVTHVFWPLKRWRVIR